MLSNRFLDKYKNHDPFKTLLQRSIYVGKYKRKEDLGWYDSVRRVVEGNANHDPNITIEECEFLYDTIFNGICTPAGRGLYTCGINMPSDAHYNCAVIPIDSFNSWSWVLKHSMLGVGVGTVYTDIDKFPTVSQRACALYTHSRKDHPNYNEVKSWDPDIACATNYVVEDSREGWCLALYYTVEGAFTGKSVNLDVSKIRERGAPLSTFDGTCSGYAPLVELCRAVHVIIRKRAGAKLRVIDCSDITNRTGVAAVMGNIRRTALNCIAPWNEEFLNAKVNLSSEQSFRYTSNNSVGIYTKEDEDFVIRNSVGIAQRVTNLGEPGFANLYKCRLDNDSNVIGLNPCQPKFALVLTPTGIKQLGDVGIGDLIWSGKRFTKIVDKWSTGIKPVYKYSTNANEVICTENHKLFQNGEKKEAKDCESIDCCEGISEVTELDSNDIMSGLLVGDGMFHAASGRNLLCIGENDKDYFKSEIKDLIVSTYKVGFGAHVVNSKFNYTNFGNTYKREVPDEYFYGNTSKIRGFLRGLYTANGSVVRTRVTLKQTSHELIKQVQKMLSAIGIRSYVTTNKATKVQFKNGEYDCKQSYDLNISSDRKKFHSLIGFIQKYKQEKLVNTLSVNTNHTKLFYEINSTEYLGEFEVFDLTVEAPEHSYWSGGCLISNCFESTLEPYEFCCLAEIVLPNLIKTSDPSKRIKAITRFLLRERKNKHSCEKAEAVRVKNMRIGLGITGYTDVNLNGSELNSIYRVTRKTATDYSMDLGVNAPIKVSVVKPSGTVAKMFGVSPGGNSPWSKYMIQRMRLGVNEPLSYSFIEAGVPFEFAASDPTNQTLCFELPVHNESYSYAVTESARDQLERQLFLQTNYTDQAVSATISFDPNKDDLSSLIKEFVPQLKASCFFPNNGGKHLQAPMEEITEEEFNKRYSAINHDHQLAHGDIQVDECKEGACLVR